MALSQQPMQSSTLLIYTRGNFLHSILADQVLDVGSDTHSFPEDFISMGWLWVDQMVG